MKLIRGSYAYLVGLFVLGAASVISVVAFFFALFSRDCADNPLLSSFGARIAGGTFTMILSAAFTVCISWFSFYVLWNALKKNSLIKPFTIVAAGLFVYAAVTVFTSFFYSPANESVAQAVLRACKAIFPLLLGVCVILLMNGARRLKIPAIVLCALCALQALFGYGFERAFGNARQADSKAVLAYISLLLFSVSLLLFFTGLCFFIAGSSFGNALRRRKAAQETTAATEQ